MNSILDYVSSGDLQVQPRVQPGNTIDDSIQNSEIEFTACHKPEDRLQSFNTGFGGNNVLHFEHQCKDRKLKTPLYKENYLGEFITEEEKAIARRALGLYSQGDVIDMSLLTAEDSLPSQSELKESVVKQLRKGGQFFSPVTQFKSVYDSDGITLEQKLREINKLIEQQQEILTKINQVSGEQTITSLEDIKLFLQGFKNGNTLQGIVEIIYQDMSKFENSGYTLNYVFIENSLSDRSNPVECPYFYGSNKLKEAVQIII